MTFTSTTTDHSEDPPADRDGVEALVLEPGSVEQVPEIAIEEAVAQGAVEESDEHEVDPGASTTHTEWEIPPALEWTPPSYEELAARDDIPEWEGIEDPAGRISSGGLPMRVTVPTRFAVGDAYRTEPGFKVVSRPVQPGQSAPWAVFFCTRYDPAFGVPNQEFVSRAWEDPAGGGLFIMEMGNSLPADHGRQC